MRKTLIVLGLLGFLSQPVLSSSAEAAGTAVPGTPVGGAAGTCPVAAPCVPVVTGGAAMLGTPTGYAAPVRVPVQREAPWWKFWKSTETKYEPACPVCPGAGTGGAAIIQQAQPVCIPQQF